MDLLRLDLKLDPDLEIYGAAIMKHARDNWMSVIVPQKKLRKFSFKFVIPLIFLRQSCKSSFKQILNFSRNL